MTKFLDPLDSAFVLLEVAGTAMNIGAVVELEADDDRDPAQRFELIRAIVAARLHEIPVFTQRIVRAPFDMTWPILVPDRRFDLDHHVVRVAVPAPGRRDQLDTLVSEFFSRPLSPRRPLWQILVVEGLDQQKMAVVLKVHHALVDGVSGAETFATLFDIAPEVRQPAPRAPSSTENTSTVTSSIGLLVEGLQKIGRRPTFLVESLASWTRRLFEIWRGLIRVGVARGRNRSTPAQPSPFEARRTSLNGAPGIEKSFHRLSVPLGDVKRAARSRGASVTDFVMTVSGGALRRLLDERGDVLKRDLIAFVPINVRNEHTAADRGNQISGMLVALHVDIANAEERLAAIAQDSSRTVGVQRQVGAQMLHDIPRVIGPTLLSLGAKFVATLGLFDRLPPVANLMISSVPGPPTPLWLGGHRLISAAPVGPLVGSISLNITVLGMDGNLEFGLLGCAEQIPDLMVLREYLREEVTRLVAAVPE